MNAVTKALDFLFKILITVLLFLNLVDHKLQLTFSVGEEEKRTADNCTHAAMSRTDLYETALHEAGHTLVMERIGVETVTSVRVFPEGSSLADGTCISGATYGELPDMNRPENVRARVAGLYGGTVATKTYLGRYGLGDRRDIYQATQYALQAVSAWGMGSGVPYSSQALIDYGFVPFALDGESRVSSLDIQRIMEEAYDLAEAHVQNGEYVLAELATALVEDEDHVLTGDEARAIINGHVMAGVPLTEEGI